MAERLADFDGLCHVVINPNSTSSSDLAFNHLIDLQYNLGNRYSHIFTDEKTAITQELIASKLSAGDIVVSAGGDGTDTLIVETLLKHPGVEEEARRTPLISLYGGNANEGPNELTPKTGRVYKSQPHVLDVIKHGNLIDVHPLEISLEVATDYEPTNEDNYENVDRLALYFASLGLIGATTAELENSRDSKFRNKPYLTQVLRTMVEAQAVRRGIQSSRRLPMNIREILMSEEVVINTNNDEVYDVSFVNGQYMAKFGRFPSHLHEDSFFKAMTTESTWPKVFKSMLQMTRAKLPGVLIDRGGVVVLDYESHDPAVQLWGHIDGDPTKYPPKGSLLVRQYPLAYQAVTTKEI